MQQHSHNRYPVGHSCVRVQTTMEVTQLRHSTLAAANPKLQTAHESHAATERQWPGRALHH